MIPAKGSRKISYPTPKFKSGLINYGGVAQEDAEIAEWMGLNGIDLGLSRGDYLEEKSL